MKNRPVQCVLELYKSNMSHIYINITKFLKILKWIKMIKIYYNNNAHKFTILNFWHNNKDSIPSKRPSFINHLSSYCYCSLVSKNACFALSSRIIREMNGVNFNFITKKYQVPFWIFPSWSISHLIHKFWGERSLVSITNNSSTSKVHGTWINQ